MPGSCHHQLSPPPLGCHHGRPAQARRRRNLFRHRGACRDPQRHRNCPGLWRGEVTVGYTEDGKRQRRKVSGTTKAAVLDKLKDLYKELEKGIVPQTGFATYRVREAAGDWLSDGVDGRAAKTIKKNQNVLEPILTVIGTRKLRELAVGDARWARRVAAGGRTCSPGMRPGAC